jgi:thiamine-phosphate pyrophosphorylase
MLREKNLPPASYETMLRRAQRVCEEHGTPLIAHGFIGAARRACCGRLHLPLPVFLENAARCAGLSVGVSVHSVEEARRAAALGAACLVAGHVFETYSKAGLAPRGLAFLAAVCAAVPVPVYGIGGVSAENIGAVRDAGAAGACLLSSFMRCEDVNAYVETLRQRIAVGQCHESARGSEKSTWQTMRNMGARDERKP